MLTELQIKALIVLIRQGSSSAAEEAIKRLLADRTKLRESVIMEECCKAVCYLCLYWGINSVERPKHQSIWHHTSYLNPECVASPIRKLMEEENGR